MWDVVVGNPPFGMRTNYIHLNIMKNSLSLCRDFLCFIMPSKPITRQLPGRWYDMFRNAVCTRIEVVGQKTFKGTQMDNTAIYYCDRKARNDQYDKQLDVDDKMYRLIDESGHRLFLDRLGRMDSLRIAIPVGSKTEEEDYRNVVEKTVEGKYYLNVNRANGSMGAKWFSSILLNEGIKTRDEEIGFCKNYTMKNIIECPTREYGDRLKSLMTGPVLRYGLWLTQTSQVISQTQFKYIPSLDYSKIDNDLDLLLTCGFTREEADTVLTYLSTFDFTQNRNDMVRDFS